MGKSRPASCSSFSGSQAAPSPHGTVFLSPRVLTTLLVEKIVLEACKICGRVFHMEVRMTVAQTLGVMYGPVKNVKAVMEGV